VQRRRAKTASAQELEDHATDQWRVTDGKLVLDARERNGLTHEGQQGLCQTLGQQAVHRAVDGCKRLYFSMSVSEKPAWLRSRRSTILEGRFEKLHGQPMKCLPRIVK
jgi:hypothetical protein